MRKSLYWLALLALSCQDHRPNPDQWLWNAQDSKASECNSTHYVRDPRTHLCFLQFACSGLNRFALTSVPCTPEVEAQLGK